MKSYELVCTHQMAHSALMHDCDGCCKPLVLKGVDKELDRIITIIENEQRLYPDSWIDPDELLDTITGRLK